MHKNQYFFFLSLISSSLNHNRCVFLKAVKMDTKIVRNGRLDITQIKRIILLAMAPKMTYHVEYHGGSRTLKTNPRERGKSHLRGENQKKLLQIGSLFLREQSALPDDSLCFFWPSATSNSQDFILFLAVK